MIDFIVAFLVGFGGAVCGGLLARPCSCRYLRQVENCKGFYEHEITPPPAHEHSFGEGINVKG